MGPLCSMIYDGIIPAYAGSTTPLNPFRLAVPDHPRICGEHRSSRPSRMRFQGSSPHMRGARSVSCQVIRDARIIPAYAGSTCPTKSWNCGIRDHPRICGEHRSSRRGSARHRGSSPHMRGAQTFPSFATNSPRIIPAYAGSTRVAGPVAVQPTDHPRICGEHGR